MHGSTSPLPAGLVLASGFARLFTWTATIQQRDSYAWVEDWESLGFCVALVEGGTREEVLRVLVRDAATPILPAEQARAWAHMQVAISQAHECRRPLGARVARHSFGSGNSGCAS